MGHPSGAGSSASIKLQGSPRILGSDSKSALMRDLDNYSKPCTLMLSQLSLLHVPETAKQGGQKA